MLHVHDRVLKEARLIWPSVGRTCCIDHFFMQSYLNYLLGQSHADEQMHSRPTTDQLCSQNHNIDIAVFYPASLCMSECFLPADWRIPQRYEHHISASSLNPPLHTSHICLLTLSSWHDSWPHVFCSNMVSVGYSFHFWIRIFSKIESSDRDCSKGTFTAYAVLNYFDFWHLVIRLMCPHEHSTSIFNALPYGGLVFPPFTVPNTYD